MTQSPFRLQAFEQAPSSIFMHTSITNSVISCNFWWHVFKKNLFNVFCPKFNSKEKCCYFFWWITVIVEINLLIVYVKSSDILTKFLWYYGWNLVTSCDVWVKSCYILAEILWFCDLYVFQGDKLLGVLYLTGVTFV